MTISEVSRLLDIPCDTLRYYERVGLILPLPKRKPNGIREYSEIDCIKFRFIKRMRKSGVTIGALTKYAELFVQGESTRDERKDLLTEEKLRLQEQIETIKQGIKQLEVVIARYESGLRPGLESSLTDYENVSLDADQDIDKEDKNDKNDQLWFGDPYFDI